jgi:hypothetical protein
VRAALCALVLLALLAVSHHLAVGMAAALGALLVSLCNVGESARARAAAMGAAAAGGALLFGLGRAMGDLWWLAVAAIFLATLVAGMAHVHGARVAAAGLFLNVIFAAGLGIGGGVALAAPSALGFALGGLSAMLVALAPRALRRPGQAPPTPSAAPADAIGPTLSWLAPVRKELTVASPLLRYAALRAAGVALAAVIVWWLGFSHAHWALAILLLCVGPDRKASLVATGEHVAGTVLGALVADAFILAEPDRLTLGLAAVALMLVALTVLDLSSVLATFCLTAAILLLVSIPAGGLSLAAEHVSETLLGAAIALVVILLQTWAETWVGGEPMGAAPPSPA